ncbi:helix-turn-helix transcriptional regulator [Aestuariibaculum lutulentum]|uniref:WYL domain-containing protein n=1 Tax=Aestuariibaculum lutulentum TaxID=2920935 RepID=A0ABS9RIJ4_9FLAO|nr:WYL domain-containing protein [Aestuariibaculum lutulentum]MCH4552770.1 WYL domain-containing protein [Aestuariibaculum lutulentum]
MSPEFLRRYYVLRIISSPGSFGIENNGYVSYKALQKALNNKRNEFYDNDLYEKLTCNTPKTIKRDIEKIKSMYHVEIALKRNYGYYIDEFCLTPDLKELYDKTELYLLNQLSHTWKEYITSEHTSLNGAIDFVGLINAIELKLKVNIKYNGWYDDNKFKTVEETVLPLHLKEINKAWYLVAQNESIGVYSFCLDDRIERLKITERKADYTLEFNEQHYFKDSIGILKTGEQPEWIHIKVANHHFRYLQTRKMHHSQEVVCFPKKPETETLDYDNPDIWGEIKIYVEPNYEFLMHILKFNIWVQVIGPQKVVDYVKEHVEKIALYYN